MESLLGGPNRLLHPSLSTLHLNLGAIRVIRKKSNILYLNFGCKYDLQIQIVAIFGKKDF